MLGPSNILHHETNANEDEKNKEVEDVRRQIDATLREGNFVAIVRMSLQTGQQTVVIGT